MPVATVVGAMIAVSTYGRRPHRAGARAAITLFGITHRLGNVDSCDVPTDPRAGEPVRVRVRTREH